MFGKSLKDFLGRAILLFPTCFATSTRASTRRPGLSAGEEYKRAVVLAGAEDDTIEVNSASAPR